MVFIRASVMPDWPGSIFDDLTNGWSPYVRGSIDVRPISCRHLELLAAPTACSLARILEECMSAAASNQTAESPVG
jgi:thioesterase domain-containing protein